MFESQFEHDISAFMRLTEITTAFTDRNLINYLCEMY